MGACVRITVGFNGGRPLPRSPGAPNAGEECPVWSGWGRSMLAFVPPVSKSAPYGPPDQAPVWADASAGGDAPQVKNKSGKGGERGSVGSATLFLLSWPVGRDGHIRPPLTAIRCGAVQSSSREESGSRGVRNHAVLQIGNSVCLGSAPPWCYGGPRSVLVLLAFTSLLPRRSGTLAGRIHYSDRPAGLQAGGTSRSRRVACFSVSQA
ncbi:hypothetical protein NDU88_007730 [Pleurodeles waltl]|uniref:Uncharacterized protein n=1 Tax=Pleurodeles waltl TaxID=8319 RepID=A0AAV7VV90_PLEWA|nr:hypothetical protein NDU88_007730 [Pleurodeles waltl]